MPNSKPQDKADPIRVLHVDDDNSLLEIAKQILQDMDQSLEIDFAFGVDEAFKKLREAEFDVVISDYEMPQKSGLDFLKELKEKGNTTPFILFTGKGREEVAIKALNLGADGYFTKQGNPETVYGELAHGIKALTERNRVKHAFEESERRYRSLLENSCDAIFVHDLTGKIIDVNRQACINLGYTKEELLQMNASQIDGDASKEKGGAYYWAKALVGETVTFESTHERKDNSSFPVEVSLRKVIIEQKDFIFASVRDITERKKAEMELKKTNKIIEAIINSTNDVIYAVDRNYNFLYANDSIAKIVDSIPSQMIGKSVFSFFPKIANTELEKNLQEALNKNEKKTFVWQGIYNKRFQEFTIFPFENGLAVFAKDVTEKIKMEYEREQKYEALERVAESLDSGLAIISRDYRVIWANKVLRNLTAGSNKKCYQTFNHLDDVCPDCGVRKIFEQNVPLDVHEYKTLKSKGETMWVELRATPLKDKNGVVTSAIEIAIPITTRKKAEEKAVLSQKEWQLTFDATTEIIMLLSPSFEILKINKAGYEALGKKTPEELIGRKCYEVAHGVDAPIAECPCAKTLKTKKAGVGELTQFGRCLALTAAPVLDENSELKAFVHTVTDITERKQREQKLVDDQNRLALMNEKLRVVGSLTRHDVGNKLMTAKSNMYLLRKKTRNDPELAKYVDAVEGALNQSSRIFEFSKLYEKIGAEKPEKVKVADSFDEAVRLIPHVGVEIINNAGSITVLADSLLRQLFYNLVDNSLKHGKTVSKIQLSYTQNDKETRLTYEDNGAGIPIENKEKIFVEGFTTGGSGLGLKLVKKMVEVYGWTITEEGALGKGAKFVITIPATAKA